MEIKQLLAGLLCTFSLPHAVAAASVFLSINGASGNHYAQTSGETSNANSISFDGSTSSASVNVATGATQAFTVAPIGSGYSNADAAIDTTLTFGAGASGTASLVLHVTGTVSPLAVAGTKASGSFTARIDGPDAATTTYRFFSFANAPADPAFPNFCTGNPMATCLVGTVFDYTGVVSFTIQPGTYSIRPDLNVGAQGAASASFTAQSHLSIPSGVAYVTALPSVTFVPEPAAGLLALLGVGLVASRVRRQRPRH